METPVQPVASDAPPTPSQSRGRARWIVGGLVAVVALGGAAWAASFLTARPVADTLRYVPGDSAVVAELRPDLPGDQRGHLGNFLAHFPGFQDQSILDAKIDEALGRLVSEGSGGTVDYATRVKPLLTGPMALALSTETLTAGASGRQPPLPVLVATTDGRITCDIVFGATTPGEAHRGVEIRTVSDMTACAVHDRHLLVGDAAGIGAAIDARLDGTGIDRDATYATARASLDGDQVATLFVAGDGLTGAFQGIFDQLGQPLPASPVIPAWTIAGLRVVDDALILDVVAPPVTGPPPPSGAPTLAAATESLLAALLPPDTLGFVEAHGIGALAERGLAELRADPARAEIVAQLDAALQVVGGADNLVGWVEDVGVAVVPTDDAVGGVVILRGIDATTAEARLAELRNLLVVASTGTDITLTDTEHAGVTITSVDLGDLTTLLGGLADVPAGLGNVPVEISLARRNDTVFLAAGRGVVERILDVGSASLGATSAYQRAIGLAGDRNDMQMYVAIDAVVATAERLFVPQEPSSWTDEIKPYVDHLAALAWASTSTSTTNHVRIVLTVK